MRILFLIMSVLAAFSTDKSNDFGLNVLLVVMALGFAALAAYMTKHDTEAV